MAGDRRRSHEDCAVYISSAQFSARRSDVKDNVPLLHHSLIDDSFDAVRRNLAANGLGEGQIPEIGIHVRHIVGSQTTDASGVQTLAEKVSAVSQAGPGLKHHGGASWAHKSRSFLFGNQGAPGVW